MGLDALDDAGVVRLRDDLAVIHTVDFFTPIVDDPYTFGRIAATNALSDVYTMGGVPICAVNIVAFPVGDLPNEVLGAILNGSIEVLHAAGAHLVGGHSVQDRELKYGLAVIGTVHPDRIIRTLGARPGQRLVLTKPLGTGIINTALKGGAASPAAIGQAVAVMTTLNRGGAEAMLTHGAAACTDVTGFGLIGHALNMLADNAVGLDLDAAAVPFIAAAREYAEMGLLPAGLHRNRTHYAPRVSMAPAIQTWMQDVLYDPQTSGGLLIAVDADRADKLTADLRGRGLNGSAVIGTFTQDHPGKITVK